MATYKGQYAYYENHSLQITDDAALYLHAADSDPEKETVLATSVDCYDNTDDFVDNVMRLPSGLHVVPLECTEDYEEYNALKQWLECFTFNKQTT